MRCVLRLKYVAVRKNGNVHSALYVADNVPVGNAGIHLHSGASVNGNSGRACLLTHFRKFNGVCAALIPALAELDGDRNTCAADNRLNNFLSLVYILHKGAAVAAGDDLADGAAHVDVNNISAGDFLGYPRSLFHDLGVVSEDLSGAGMLVFRNLKKAFGFLVVIYESLCTYHFRAGIGSAVLPAYLPEGKVRYPRHRGEGEFSVYFNVSDFDHSKSKGTA